MLNTMGETQPQVTVSPQIQPDSPVPPAVTDQKRNTRLLIFAGVALVVVLIIALVIGYFLGQNSVQVQEDTTDVISTSCDYGGETYQDGDNFPADDGCNTCFCDDGNVGCTERYCVPDDEIVDETDAVVEEVSDIPESWSTENFTVCDISIPVPDTAYNLVSIENEGALGDGLEQKWLHDSNAQELSYYNPYYENVFRVWKALTLPGEEVGVGVGYNFFRGMRIECGTNDQEFTLSEYVADAKQSYLDLDADTQMIDINYNVDDYGGVELFGVEAWQLDFYLSGVDAGESSFVDSSEYLFVYDDKLYKVTVTDNNGLDEDMQETIDLIIENTELN